MTPKVTKPDGKVVSVGNLRWFFEKARKEIIKKLSIEKSGKEWVMKAEFDDGYKYETEYASLSVFSEVMGRQTSLRGVKIEVDGKQYTIGTKEFRNLTDFIDGEKIVSSFKMFCGRFSKAVLDKWLKKTYPNFKYTYGHSGQTSILISEDFPKDLVDKVKKEGGDLRTVDNRGEKQDELSGRDWVWNGVVYGHPFQQK